MLDVHVSACLEKNWPVLGMLIGLVRRLVGAAVFTRASRKRTNHLLRMAEAFARRLLVLRAATLGPFAEPESAGKRAAGTRPQSGLRPEPASGRRCLSLAEPLPEFVPLADTPFPPAASRLGAGETDLDAETDPALAVRRLAVLMDILDRPAHHARRMALWLKRFTARTNRTTPFGLGRPPGCLRRPPDEALDRKLRDADYFARRVLSLAPG